MNNKTQHIFNKAKEHTLSAAERASMRQHIITFMEQNPLELPHEIVARESTSRGIKSPYVFFHRYAIVPTIILLVAISSGGASWAATHSLPGDALYFFKIHVNENLQSVLAFSSESKAEVEAKHAMNRLEEAEKLAVRNSLVAEVHTQLAIEFKNHAEEVEKNVKLLEAKGETQKAEELKESFDTSLEAHKTVLISLAEQDRAEENKKNLLSIATDIEGKISVQEDVRVEASTTMAMTTNQAAVNSTTATKENVQKVREKAEVEIAALTKISKENNLSELSKTDAQAQIAIATNYFNDGKLKFETELYADSMNSFKLAYRTARRANALIKARAPVEATLKGSLKIKEAETASSTLQVSASSTSLLKK